MNLTELKAKLKSGNISGWYIICGEEGHTVENAMAGHFHTIARCSRTRIDLQAGLRAHKFHFQGHLACNGAALARTAGMRHY